MASQTSTRSNNNVEVIDLTNETTRQNTTITLDDSHVAIEIDSSESNHSDDKPVEYPPEPSPPSFHYNVDCDELIVPSDSSPEHCRIPSPDSAGEPSIIQHISSSDSDEVSEQSTLKASPRLRLSSTPQVAKPKPNKSQLKELKKQSREEAKRLKQQQKDEEKLQKEANRLNAASRALDNCTAVVSKSILKIINDPDEVVFKTLFDESMIKYRLSEHPRVDDGITWTYKRTEIVDNACVPKFKDSNWVSVVIPASDYLKKILTYKTKPDDNQSIKTHIVDLRRRTQSDIILMVYNLANYLKSERMKEAKNYRKTFKDRFESRKDADSDVVVEEDTSNTPSLGITELQELRLILEAEIKHELPNFKLHIEFHEKTNEVVNAIVRYTLSIAKFENKQKVRTSTGLDWAINMDKERAVDPTKSTEDLTKLWITQLQQFTQITLPIAKAIAAEYPSPCALLDQYKNLTKTEGEELLAELYVQRNVRRQIGIHISKRVHCFLTSQDPDIHLGLS